MREQTPALVRTLTPMLVGAVATWLLHTLGVVLPMEPAAEVVTAVLSGLYYTIARFLEARWPALGRILLGSALQPHYDRPEEEAPEAYAPTPEPSEGA